MTYNPAKNSKDSYDLAIAKCREKLESFPMVEIGACRLYQGDCMEIMPLLPKFDAVVTDPPYGCKKAAWDDRFPQEWYHAAHSEMVVTITGSAGLCDALALVGCEYIDTIAARNLNGMTRGPLGFGNWLSAVVSRGKPRQGVNFFDFSVTGDMPDHPSPKPIAYMEKLIFRVTEANQTILDPFMGSGTTGVACAKMGRKFTGIEIDPNYFETACKRIEEAYAQPDLFIEAAKPEAEQIDIFEGGNHEST